MKRQRKWHKLPKGFRWLKRGEIISRVDYWILIENGIPQICRISLSEIGNEYGKMPDDNRTLKTGLPVIRPLTPGEQALNALDL